MIHRRVFLTALLMSPSAFAQPAPLFDSLTQADASRGVKAALALAAQNATTRLGERNGFFGAPRVRIPLPRLLASAQQNLRPMGLSAPLDDLQEKIGRAHV